MLIKSQTARIDFEELVGDTLPMRFAYAGPVGNINLTGSIVTAEIIDPATNTALLTYSTAIGTIITSGTDYNIVFDVTSAQTTQLNAGNYLYTVRIQDSLGNVNTLINGVILLKRGML